MAGVEAEAALMMGIAMISVDPVLQEVALVQLGILEGVVDVQITDRTARARWVFTDEKPNKVNTMALVALATPSRSVMNEEVLLKEDKLFI